MQIDIWSDIVCPWCYLGKRRFEKALAAFERRDDVHISHRSFQLDPTRAKGETASPRVMLRSKYRLSEEQVRAMDQKMEQTAADAGLDATEVRAALETGAYADAVTRDLNEARSLGVTGVPFFVIDGRYGISGAQATDVFSHALTLAAGSERSG